MKKTHAVIKGDEKTGTASSEHYRVMYKSRLLIKFFPNRDSHWLILGHMALTKSKCIPIMIH